MTDTVDDPAFWAVVEHHRLWWAADGPYRKRVEADKGLTVEVAEVIARDYGVARTIGKVEDEDREAVRGLPDLVASINGITRWPNDLPTRALTCLDIAKAHAKKHPEPLKKNSEKAKQPKTPISAVTKLVWFLRPSGWTMFDTYARHGLIGSTNSIMTFYERLADADFTGRSRAIKALCVHHGFGELWGERIIDKFLMLHGAQRKDEGGRRFYARARWMNQAYLALLPEDTGGRLTALATDVRGLLTGGEHPLLVWAPRPRKGKHQTTGGQA